MIGFNMNGKSSNARLDFIRKETGKVKSRVQITDMYVPAAPPNPIRGVFPHLQVRRKNSVRQSHSLVIDEIPNPKKLKNYQKPRHNMRKLEDGRSLSLVFCLKGPLIKTFPSPSYIG